MHIVDTCHRLMTATGIVGGTISLALGTALVADEEGAVVAVYFGDGASNTGGFHECLNMAALWSLPVLYRGENNARGALGAKAGEFSSSTMAICRGMVWILPKKTVDHKHLPQFARFDHPIAGIVPRQYLLVIAKWHSTSHFGKQGERP